MKTAILLLHGALGNAAQFDELITRFPKDQVVYALDFPGHGPTAPQEPFSMDLFSQSVLSFMDKHQIAAANIFGYSMGGYLALYLAEKFPTRVQQVCTLGTKLDWNPEVAAGMNRMFNPEKISEKVPAFAQALDHMHADWKGLCRYTAAFLTDLGNGLGIEAAAYSRISCPVSIGWGSEDNVVQHAESKLVADQIPYGKLEELPGVKHQLELVDMDILFKFVERSLL